FLVDVVAQTTAGGGDVALGQKGDHVDRDQRVGEARDGAHVAHPHDFGALFGTLGAAHAHLRGGHAVGADRPAAVGAGDPRFARGMAIAGGHVLATAYPPPGAALAGAVRLAPADSAAVDQPARL